MVEERDVGDVGDVEDVEELEVARPRGWAPETPPEAIFVETGRGQAARVQAGVPFVDTVKRIAEEANYGGYFSVSLNGEAVINTEDAPATIERGMRIAITSYDKAGFA